MSAAAGQRRHRVELRRPLDEDRVGLHLGQRLAHGPGRTRPVVAHAEDGDAAHVQVELPAGAVEVVPAVALLDDGLEVLGPHEPVLHRVLHHCAGQAGGDVGGSHHAVAEMGGERSAAGHHRDGLGRRQRGGRRLQLGAAVGGHAGAQLPEHRDHPADLGQGVELGGQPEGGAELGHPPGDDADLLLGVGRAAAARRC